ncbi:polynucleotide 3' [Panicum miliaceum]|uniref:Polynucleotide 3 n=1 Tax=Panicum miliaceum TaxID=4540 RepID=A0A3L6R379_PANMI|nr:polynucleotide 3' [Panicum miliaceum]
MLVAPLSSLSLARSPGRLRFLLPASAARVARLAMSTAAAAVSVEYAKSGRSTCKGCSGAIASGALRLGASTPDPRGFDATKWYHVACFPSDASHPLGPVESINGFDSIKEADRDELHELVKNRKRDQTAEPSPKKAKTQMSSPAEGVSDKASVSVEYAKSGRSACKGCSENIAKGALRLGASFHDPRGFENTKWYHIACFPTSSYPVFPVDNLKGFDSIEDHDCEKLQELVESVGDSNEVTEKNPEEVKNRDNKVDKTVDPLDEPSPKKVKAHMSSSMKGMSEKASVLVEYAKSGRSTCKGCSKNIAKGALRLGASAHDPRGYDSTKWYHVACFPASSYPIFPVENLKGFDSIKNNDREKLLELGEVVLYSVDMEKNYKRDGNAADQSSEPSLKEEMVDSTRISKEGAENNLEEVKLSAGNNRIRPVISFSVSDTNKDYKGATLPTHWKAFETVIFREQEDGLHASAKIAAFDFDGCLAKTSVRIIGADKWSLQHKSIPKKLQSLYNDGYKLVIFTNESNIDRWKNKRQEAVDSKVGRLDNFIECVKVPIQVFIACGLGQGKGTPDDPYRKPNPGMWWLMAQHFNSGIEIDMDK